jgi:hypothetical protein
MLVEKERCTSKVQGRATFELVSCGQPFESKIQEPFVVGFMDHNTLNVVSCREVSTGRKPVDWLIAPDRHLVQKSISALPSKEHLS